MYVRNSGQKLLLMHIMPNVTVLNQFEIIFGPISFENELLSFIVFKQQNIISMDHIGLTDPQTLMFSKLFLANMNILRDYWPFKMII